MKEVAEAARAYLGCPWRHQGRNRLGMDCAGLVVLACRDAGRPIKDLKGYTRHPWRDGLVQALESNFTLVDGAHEPGDILLFRITRYPQHIGIATDRGMIHSHLGSPGVVEHGLDAYWKDRLVGAYRL